MASAPAPRRAQKLSCAGSAAGFALDQLAQAQPSPAAKAALSWSEICGQPLARFAQPLGFEDGFLIVGVSGGGWREALFQERALVIARLRARDPRIRGFRLTALPPPAPAAAQPAQREPKAHPQTADIEDLELKRACDRLLEARAQRPPSAGAYR